MSMLDWAKNEVKLACEFEREAAEKDGNPEDSNYGESCYVSALKAFECLCEEGHSGFSINITKNILNRLIDRKPLRPIEDTEDCWNLCAFRNEYALYQNKRMASLFKDVYPDGTIYYHDNDRFVTVDISNGTRWYNKFISKIASEIYPLQMPYYPLNKPILVYREDFLTNVKNGDYDTIGIIYSELDGERIDINRYFKEQIDGNGYDEISAEEYFERKAKRIIKGGE